MKVGDGAAVDGAEEIGSVEMGKTTPPVLLLGRRGCAAVGSVGWSVVVLELLWRWERWLTVLRRRSGRSVGVSAGGSELGLRALLLLEEPP